MSLFDNETPAKLLSEYRRKCRALPEAKLKKLSHAHSALLAGAAREELDRRRRERQRWGITDAQHRARKTRPRRK
jgi:hypothetical protein